MNDLSSGKRWSEYPVFNCVLLYSLSYGLCLLLSGMFLTDISYRAILAIPASIMLFCGIRRFIKNRQTNDRQEQYRTILSYLLAQAGIGRSLEQSLRSARAALSKDYPPKHALSRTLLQVEHQILANQTAGNTINLLIQALDCKEATIGLGILKKISLSGASLLAYLRQANQSLADLMEISRDIASQNARTSAEAGILAVMPFIMTALLRQSGDYLKSAQAHPVGAIAFGIAYLTAIMALSIIPGILVPEIMKNTRKLQPKKGKQAGKSMIKAAEQFRILLTRLLGDRVSRRTDEALQRLYGESVASRRLYDLQKVQYGCAGFLLGTILTFSLKSPFALFITPIILIVLQDQLLFRKAKKEELILLSSFPFFLHICVSLLEAGLSVHPVLTLVSGAFSENIEISSRTPIEREAHRISQSLRAGLPTDQILGQMAAQSTTSELRSSYQLLSRYNRLGSHDLLQQLLQQTNVCWAMYRHAARSQMDEQSMKMMLPMMLDLIVVLVVAITPAVLSMGSRI